MNAYILLVGYIFSGLIFATLIIIFYRLLFSKSAPFVPIPNEALEKLLAPIVIQKGNVVYDLGCGDGRVLLFLTKKYPDATYKGIELRIFPFLLAQWKTRKYKNIHITRGNFFEVPLSDATHIVTYLFPSVMDSLLPKLEQELKQATLISFDFPFSKKSEIKKYEIPERRGKLGSCSFLYIFEQKENLV